VRALLAVAVLAGIAAIARGIRRAQRSRVVRDRRAMERWENEGGASR
jgi:hypothetical protein